MVLAECKTNHTKYPDLQELTCRRRREETPYPDPPLSLSPGGRKYRRRGSAFQSLSDPWLSGSWTFLVHGPGRERPSAVPAIRNNPTISQLFLTIFPPYTLFLLPIVRCVMVIYCDPDTNMDAENIEISWARAPKRPSPCIYFLLTKMNERQTVIFFFCLLH